MTDALLDDDDVPESPPAPESVAESPGYPLTCPTEESAIASLERILGAPQGREAWERACLQAGVSIAGRPLLPEQMQAVAENLAGVPGITGVFGVALRVRVETYMFFAANGDKRK